MSKHLLSSKSRLLLLLGSVPLLVVISALLYMQGMSRLEGDPRTFWQSLEWAAETFTTTGYGADARWSHPLMIVFVSGLQFLGVFLVFLVFPIYLIPFLEERFEVRLPRKAPALSDHLVIFRFSPAVERLLEQTQAAGLGTLILESDESVARRLFERGQIVVPKGLDDGGLEASGLLRARALIANGSDDENAALILAARQMGFAGDILALVENPAHRRPMALAGATHVFTPRHILGAALAARASARISPRLSGIQQLGRKLEIGEVRIQPESELAGKSLGESGLGSRTGATVIGQWVGGELMVPPTSEMRLHPNGILIVVGRAESLHQVSELAGGGAPLRRSGPFVVGGFGEVGRKVAELLREVGEEVKVIDRQAIEGVDVVGDVLDPQLFERLEPESAQAVILALDTDSATLFATVIVKELAPQVPVIARVNQAQNIERIHRAGADFSLSISQVSGQILARRLLGEEAVMVDPQLKVVRVGADGLVGRHPSQLRIRERTHCSVVAVERGDEVLVELGEGFRFAEGDMVYICGSDEEVRGYREEFGEARKEAP